MNKEEHLWEMMSDNKYTTRDLRLWVCEALAERDAAREESKVLNDFVNKLKTIINSDNDSMISLNGILNAVLALKEREADLAKLKAAQPEVIDINVATDAVRSALDRARREDLWTDEFRLKRALVALESSVGEVQSWPEWKEWRAKRGDEPAEAPDPFARDIQGNLIPQAEPTVPAQKQEGPFSVASTRGAECRIDEGGVWSFITRDRNCEMPPERLVRILNLGAEEEKLRARVAELERNVEIATTNGLRATQAHNRELARADLAEAKLAERERQIDSMQEASASFVRERDELKAKLAALGESPIPRALVERWHSYASGLQSGAWFAELLAGREPGMA